MTTRTGLFAAFGAVAGSFVLDHLRRRSRINLRDKVVLITGGSRGLGLAMAREFGARGSIIAVCARSQHSLERAEADLLSRGVRAHTFVCDIGDRAQVDALIADVSTQLGPIDILVNNAGIIKVGPLSNMTVSDFEQAMRVMFWGPVYTTLGVLPEMRARKQGSIVNITSIGGKISVPHLLPYSCAKFAAVALSEGLRAELAPTGIRVTTIVPGLLRTGSHLHAEFKGNQAEEYSWFAAGAATPLVSINAERAARSIVRATVDGTGEKILSIPADIGARFHGLFPGISTELLSLMNHLLPNENRSSNEVRTGHEIEANVNSSFWKTITIPGRQAAESLKEAVAGPAL